MSGLAKMAPSGTEMLVFAHLDKIRDGELDALTEEMDNALMDTDIDPNPGDIKTIGMIDERVIVISGSLNPDEMREYLEDDGYDEDTYQGVELWVDDSDEAVAFYDNLLLPGDIDDVKECIRIINGDETSAYEDDSDLRRICDKVSAGIIAMVMGDQGDAEYMGFEISGNDRDHVTIHGIVKFANSNDAEDGEAQLESVSDMYQDLQISRDNEFLEFSFKIDTEDAADFFNF